MEGAGEARECTEGVPAEEEVLWEGEPPARTDGGEGPTGASPAEPEATPPTPPERSITTSGVSRSQL